MKSSRRRAQLQRAVDRCFIERCERRILFDGGVDGGDGPFGFVYPSPNALEGSPTTVQVATDYEGGFAYDVIWDGLHWNGSTTLPFSMEPLESRPSPIERTHTYPDSGDYWVMVV